MRCWGHAERVSENIHDARLCNCNCPTAVVSVVDAFHCLCDPGYTGPRCEQDIDDCVDNMCSNRSICRDRHLVSAYFFLKWRRIDLLALGDLNQQ